MCGDPADFCVSTRGAGAGGLALAVEGPSKAEIGCQDNKDGTVNVSYLPTAPGEYKVREMDKSGPQVLRVLLLLLLTTTA